ncbi:RxLR effector protein [Phytophthora cinnamomi]|uniref:RxLR effector protein n=1 Tax=Phytophthora cinnamomi TaxID=4785 RepID=UPI00355A025C|nr:RxLR effector protein [Phytophthora cinnamomi]
MIAFIASFLDFAVAKKTVDVEDTAKLLRGGVLKPIEREKAARLSEEEERGAKQALSKVTSLLGLKKGPTKLTQAKLDRLQTYAKSNPDKWWMMTYYVTYTLGIALTAYIAYGFLFLGWRPATMGSPRAN